tara:strand:- start:287 stop:511 length:225 start_codon:yes stop_codon:yes gene_type:complete
LATAVLVALVVQAAMVLHHNRVEIPHGLLLMVICLPLVVDLVRWEKHLNLPQELVDLVEVVMEKIQLPQMEEQL